MISVKNVSFSYGKEATLVDISADFERGKITAVIGENGSGKTTLLRVLARLAEVKCGERTVLGTPYGELSSREFARRVSYLPQGRYVTEMTVAEAMEYTRYARRQRGLKIGAEDRAAIAEALAITDTERFANRSVKSLSFGERQRVYLAMQIAQGADFALMDEPTNFLDAGATFAVMEQMQLLRERGVGVVAVLHSLPLALKYADKILLMKSGRLAFCGSPEELLASEKIENAFGVRCQKVTAAGEVDYIIKKM